MLGLPLLLRLGLVGLALWLVSGIALYNHRCEHGTLNLMSAHLLYPQFFSALYQLAHSHFTGG